jgi:hypothetical protein
MHPGFNTCNDGSPDPCTDMSLYSSRLDGGTPFPTSSVPRQTVSSARTGMRHRRTAPARSRCRAPGLRPATAPPQKARASGRSARGSWRTAKPCAPTCRPAASCPAQSQSEKLTDTLKCNGLTVPQLTRTDLKQTRSKRAPILQNPLLTNLPQVWSISPPHHRFLELLRPTACRCSTRISLRGLPG